MVNTQERSNKSANVNEIEQLKGSSNSTGSVGSASSTSPSSLSTSSSSSLSNVGSSLSSSPASSSSSAASVKSVSATTSSAPTNFAKNASAHAASATAQSVHHKLIPIQSVLNTNTTAADHQQQHLHQNNHNSYHHNTSSAYNHHSSSNNLQLPQSGAATHLNVPTSTLQNFLAGATTHAQLPSELPHEDEERLGNLFKQLDRDGNGRIDIHDLSEALREFGLSSVYAEVSTTTSRLRIHYDLIYKNISTTSTTTTPDINLTPVYLIFALRG